MIHFPENHIRIPVNNLIVAYTDIGKKEAPVIIFIHGFPFNKSMWNIQVEALNGNYRLIAFDIRGHGNSESLNVDFSIELFVKDLISLMDILRIDKAVLCGLSMGGYIALNAIEFYPERFSALILSDTNCIADTPEVKEKRMKAIETIRKKGVDEYAEESIKNLFAQVSFKTKKQEIALVKKMIINTSEQSLASTLLALSIRKDTCMTLNGIKVPVLIIVGKEDKITPVSASQLMHEKIKNSILCIIENAGHLSNMENPEEFNTGLIKFISSVY
jgi:3-oxoadipate enol-lactonase